MIRLLPDRELMGSLCPKRTKKTYAQLQRFRLNSLPNENAQIRKYHIIELTKSELMQF